MVEPTKSKAYQERESKKLKRKIQQAISTIQRAEDCPMERLVTSEPTKYCLITHSGCGDAADQTLVSDFCSQFDERVQVTIFPGINYGHLAFSEEQHLQTLFSSIEFEVPDKSMGAHLMPETLRCLVFLKTKFACSELRRH